jgi:hypothetical protein
MLWWLIFGSSGATDRIFIGFRWVCLALLLERLLPCERLTANITPSFGVVSEARNELMVIHVTVGRYQSQWVLARKVGLVPLFLLDGSKFKSGHFWSSGPAKFAEN